MVTIERSIRDSLGEPIAGIPVEAFQHHPFGDLNLSGTPNITNSDGYFKIVPQNNTDNLNSNVYIIITDKLKEFVSVRDMICIADTNQGSQRVEVEKPD